MSFGAFNNPVFNAVPFNGAPLAEVGLGSLVIDDRLFQSKLHDDQSFKVSWIDDQRIDRATWIDARTFDVG